MRTHHLLAPGCSSSANGSSEAPGDACCAPKSAGRFDRLRRLCTFVENTSQNVCSYLQTHLRAQDRALESVVAAVEAWEFSRSIAKHRMPLVLATTGPTGTGKTEAANLHAESLFQCKKKLGNSEKQVSSGGEDFGDNFTNPVTEYAYHRQMKTK
ncbi:hypothetical protein PybrP1_010534 [[Pythium] brassicae (nom. inval.)]|nr:hypothetical protein PybrP1_010534 [[Pythium] brassicae (nom. inval.)]